jgi:hypothetical protein
MKFKEKRIILSDSEIKKIFDNMIDVDIQAILLFLRTTSFGGEFTYNLIDPKTNIPFETTVIVDELNYIKPKHEPDSNGYFSFMLPKSKKNVKLRLVTLGDQRELEKIENQYPTGMVAPIVTKRLEKNIVELDGDSDKMKISQFINQMPISDSKDLRKFLRECEPKIDLNKTVVAPSGEKVTFDVTFGAEFFRPFFSV